MAERFQRKPQIIEAAQFPRDVFSKGARDTINNLAEWCDGLVYIDAVGGVGVMVEAVEEQQRVGPGDWIIKDDHGFFYGCADEVFTATYDPIPETEIQE